VLGSVTLLLGIGLAPAHAGHHATTTLRGFAATPASVRLGGTVVDRVQVLPRSRRVVRVQARKPGATRFLTVSSGFTTRHGGFRAVYRPTTVGTWRYRLVLPATRSAKALTSVSRAVTATTDTTAPGPVTGLTVVHGPTSDLTLSWTNPTAPDFAGVMIRRVVGPSPPASPTAGTLVTRTAEAATSYTDTGLAGDTQYSYALFAFDTAANNAPAVTASATSGAVTTAALSLNGSTGATAKQTVSQSQSFVLTGTHAGKDRTMVSGTLDYGDGAQETFVGDPATWMPTPHQYDALGPVTVTLTVVDSASKSVTTTLVVTVFANPTATITVDQLVPLEKGKPVLFHVTSATPDHTVFTDFDRFSGLGDNFVAGTGPPPPSFQITFPTPGTYSVTVEGFNDAGGLASATVDVVIPDLPQP
jgi:hypothetical protein